MPLNLLAGLGEGLTTVGDTYSWLKEMDDREAHRRAQGEQQAAQHRQRLKEIAASGEQGRLTAKHRADLEAQAKQALETEFQAWVSELPPEMQQRATQNRAASRFGTSLAPDPESPKARRAADLDMRKSLAKLEEQLLDTRDTTRRDRDFQDYTRRESYDRANAQPSGGPRPSYADLLREYEGEATRRETTAGDVESFFKESGTLPPLAKPEAMPDFQTWLKGRTLSTDHEVTERPPLPEPEDTHPRSPKAYAEIPVTPDLPAPQADPSPPRTESADAEIDEVDGRRARSLMEQIKDLQRRGLGERARPLIAELRAIYARSQRQGQ